MLLTIITTPLYDDKRKENDEGVPDFDNIIIFNTVLSSKPTKFSFFFFGTRHEISFLGNRVILILQFFIYKTYKLICQILNTKQQKAIKIHS